ncbi:alpha/beta fold hydrolase [Nocardia carnea]|uniref:alpha/beta fold hydrolase n=1 Tax=Nocardia carnea TaxID=37328 RepID=UPI002457C6D2|nr:alpha/beta hydrolase [Nocardia carnea]
MASNFPPDPSSVRYDGVWTHRDVHANGIRLHVASAGPGDNRAGPGDPAPQLVVLLHGFADFWWTWRHQLTALAELGYHAVAVDLRGYGDSDKPPRGYDGWTLAGDIAGLIRALGYSDATLVGHADGGLVCWATAVLHPRLVRGIAVVSSPHPAALKSSIWRDNAQRRAFLPGFLRAQLPRYPERLLTREDGRGAADLLTGRSSPTWSDTAECADTAARMASAIRIPGAAHCALEYKRWAFRSQWRPDGRRFIAVMRKPVDIPVVSLRGEFDRYILPHTVHRAPQLAPRRRVVTVRDAAHFAHQENPEAVTAEIAKLLAGEGGRGRDSYA